MIRVSALVVLLLGAFGCATNGTGDVSPPQSTATSPPADVQREPVTAAAEVTADVVARDARIAPAMRVRVVCSETDLRTAIAILEWRADERPAAADQRIDFTVYAEGFERGWFASIPMSRGVPEMTARLRAMDASRKMRAFDVTAAPATDRPELRNRDEKTTAIEVRNVEPGMLYRFRVAARTERGWVASEDVEVETPVCVDDRKDRD
jgi:hypothetical protein